VTRRLQGENCGESGKASHRGHGGHRGGTRGYGRGFTDTAPSGRELCESGKASHRGHGGRTRGYGRGFIDTAPSVRARTCANRGKHPTEVTEVTKGEPAGYGDRSTDTAASGRELRESGKASHRGHGGHEGEPEDTGSALLTRQLQGENCANWEKHRTEVTEVTEGKPEDRGRLY
jgi:hypothetical protein